MSTEGSRRKPPAQLSKEQIIQAVMKKRQCKAKSKQIIENLLQNPIDPNDFLNMIKDINRCHYEDVVEERFILKLCGYPICPNVLENIPEKQYMISTTANKVYDITQRKKFCSAKCFKSSEYIKMQMLTSPLWLRDQEDIPEFQLLNIT